jgi:hypothetical protein
MMCTNRRVDHARRMRQTFATNYKTEVLGQRPFSYAPWVALCFAALAFAAVVSPIINWIWPQ